MQCKILNRARIKTDKSNLVEIGGQSTLHSIAASGLHTAAYRVLSRVSIPNWLKWLALRYSAEYV